jgi:hypothetical protein
MKYCQSFKMELFFYSLPVNPHLQTMPWNGYFSIKTEILDSETHL